MNPFILNPFGVPLPDHFAIVVRQLVQACDPAEHIGLLPDATSVRLLHVVDELVLLGDEDVVHRRERLC